MCGIILKYQYAFGQDPEEFHKSQCLLEMHSFHENMLLTKTSN